MSGEAEKSVLHQETRSGPPPPPPTSGFFAVADVFLRFLLFASALVAVLVMVTSKQTETFQAPGIPPLTPPVVTVTRPAKFKHSPAFVYFIAALSVAGLYSLITTIVSLFALLKRNMSTILLSHLIILDVLLLGVVAAATGAAGAVAYIGLKGNSHTGWTKICNRYDKFCRHIGSSVAVSLVASVVLVLLVLLNVYALSKKIPK